MTVEPRADLPNTYRVYYNVDLTDPFRPVCDCKAGCYTDRVCKHIRAALAHQQGEPIPE